MAAPQLGAPLAPIAPSEAPTDIDILSPVPATLQPLDVIAVATVIASEEQMSLDAITAEVNGFFEAFPLPFLVDSLFPPPPFASLLRFESLPHVVCVRMSFMACAAT